MPKDVSFGKDLEGRMVELPCAPLLVSDTNTSTNVEEPKDKYSCILGVIILLCNKPLTLLIRAPDKRG